MAKPKRFKITLLVTVEEIGHGAHERRPIVAELTTRPWYPPEGERQRRRRNGERHENERPR